MLAGERLQSLGPVLRHLCLKDSPDALEDKIIIKLHRGDSIGIKGTAHIAELMRAFLEWADPAADKGGHQILAV